jgi:hypothetical protein
LLDRKKKGHNSLRTSLFRSDSLKISSSGSLWRTLLVKKRCKCKWVVWNSCWSCSVLQTKCSPISGEKLHCL